MKRFIGLGRKFAELKTELTKPPGSAPEPYQHQSLPTDPNTAFIRVFELARSDPSSSGTAGYPLQGRLIPVDIAATPLPIYGALSYSWGRDILTGRLQDAGSFSDAAKFISYTLGYYRQLKHLNRSTSVLSPSTVHIARQETAFRHPHNIDELPILIVT